MTEPNTPTTGRGCWTWLGVLLAGAVLVGLGLSWWIWSQRPRLSEERVRSLVYTSIQREAPASFLVTGTLDVMATTTVSNTRYLLPDLLRLSLGTSSATVRLPARIHYGFDVRELRPEMIRLESDSVLRVRLPPLRVHAVEPRLTQMQVETERGWARLDPDTPRRLEQRALAAIEAALRRQGAEHLESSTQPRLNTARAMERLLLPVLQGAGMEAPRLRFEITSEIEMRPRR